MTNRNQPTTYPLRRRSRLRAPTGLNISRALDEARRRDFLSFVKMSFDLLTPGKLLLMERYIEALAYHLEQVRVGRIRRLIINLPPRYLKSLITSVAFPAYVLGHDPTKRLIVISYGSELAVSLANDFRKVISSPRYKSVFPGLQLSRMKNTEYEIATTRGGFRLATSVDGPLTGRGGDIIIVDDPLKRSDASSESKREHVNEWYRNTLHSMLDDKHGAIIIVMQRLHDDDLCGFVLKNSRDWVVLNFPAIAREDEQIQIGDGRFHHRRVGDVLHPGLESKSDLDNTRSLIGEHLFAAQYQQCPIQPAGMMIKRDAIKRYDHLPIRTKSHFTIQSWDTAIKTDAHNDYSVCVTLLVDDRGNYYVIDVLRDRLLYHQLKAQAIAQAQKHRPNRILIEEAGLVGRTLVKDLKAAGLPAVGVVPDGDKRTRASIQVEKFENGQVFFPREAPWLADFETELLAFPNGSYDDQVDALIQGLAYKRPAESDASLPGFENFVTGLWLSKMRGF
jgi:predicted phage terminase large subunit-like protein